MSSAELMELQSNVQRIHVAPALLDYVQAIVEYTRRSPHYVAGLSPRAALALVHSARAWALLEGRDKVIPEDVQAILAGVAAHRLRPAHDSARRIDVGGDLVLFHRLEQRRLRFRRGAVDFVGEDHLREDRAGAELEAAAVALVDRHAEDVGGQHVAGELDALELQAERSREHVRQRGLADSRQVLDQQVAAREQAGQRQSDLCLFAENDLAGRLDRAIDRRPGSALRLELGLKEHALSVHAMGYDESRCARHLSDTPIVSSMRWAPVTPSAPRDARRSGTSW